MKLKEAIAYTQSIRKNQYAVGKVGAIDFKYLSREKQLYIQAQSVSSTGKGVYKTTIVFNRITSSDLPDEKHPLPYSGKEGAGAEVYIEQPTVNHDILLRCQCQDFYFMWALWDKNQKALIGPYKPYQRVPGSTRPPVNPTQTPGLCKHQLALIKKLMAEGLIKKDSTVWSYLTRPVRVE